MDDNFLTEQEPDNEKGELVATGENLVTPADLKPRQFANSIMAVYQQLGGDTWLLTQARENPREFMGLLKAILPKNADLNMDMDIQVVVAGRYGDPTAVRIKGSVQ